MSLSIDGLYGSYGDMYANSSTSSSATTDALQNSLQAKDFSTSTEQELMEVCKEFEAYFTEQVFKALERMVPTSDDEDGGSIASSTSSSMSSYMDYFGDMLTQEYAAASADSNNGQGLGIAQMLYEQMKRNYGL